MDRLEQLLGPLHWDIDAHAAVKFCLLECAGSHFLPHLTTVLPDNAETRSLIGDPGWYIERRNDGDTTPFFADWPRVAKYRAFVDPDEFPLGAPEGFYTRAQFMPFVHTTVAAYLSVYPDRKRELLPLLTLLQQPGFALPEPVSLARPASTST